MKMYMEAPETEPAKLEFSPSMILALTIAVVGVLYIGVFPHNVSEPGPGIGKAAVLEDLSFEIGREPGPCRLTKLG